MSYNTKTLNIIFHTIIFFVISFGFGILMLTVSESSFSQEITTRLRKNFNSCHLIRIDKNLDIQT